VSFKVFEELALGLQYHSDTSDIVLNTMRAVQSIASALAFGRCAFAAFGFTSTSKGYSVDTDGGLVFEVNKYFCPISPFAFLYLTEIDLMAI